MKKVFLGALILVTVGIIAVWFSGQPSSSPSPTTGNSSSNAGTSQTDSPSNSASGNNGLAEMPEVTGDVDSDGLVDQQARPATEVFQNAEEALKAVKEGAKTYDDLIIEQFTELGPHCSWCDSFYQSLRDMTFAADTTTDERSFFSELLAVSGRVDNVEALLKAAESAQGQDNGQIFSEALELTVGGDDVVSFLGSKIPAVSPELKETIVAAISNQGTDLAVNTLYKATVDMANPDGYYSQGTGLGELIPEEGAFPSLKGFISKRDDYSHLAVKALFNAGLDGVRAVFETLNTSSDPERDKKILKDSIDHLSFDEGLETYMKETGLKSQNPALAELSKQALDSFEKQQQELAAEEEAGSGSNIEDLLSPNNPPDLN